MQYPSPRINQKVCFIAGTGHSGSTLLGLLLGNHSTGFFCGEGKKSLYLNREKAPDHKRYCKFCGPECPIWSQLVLDADKDLYEQLAQRVFQYQGQSKSLMIDSSSGIDWILQQWQFLNATTAQPYLIFLQRDGRGVVNSYRRKYPERDFIQIIDKWLASIQTAQALFDQFTGDKMILHYEELASYPEIALKRTCEFLKIAYEPEMLTFEHSEYHVLGGNNGTQYWIDKNQGNAQSRFLDRMSDNNRKYYQNHNSEIVLDLRWQAELSQEQQAIFADLAGEVNRSFEWNP